MARGAGRGARGAEKLPPHVWKIREIGSPSARFFFRCLKISAHDQRKPETDGRNPVTMTPSEGETRDSEFPRLSLSSNPPPQFFPPPPILDHNKSTANPVHSD